MIFCKLDMFTRILRLALVYHAQLTKILWPISTDPKKEETLFAVHNNVYHSQHV